MMADDRPVELSLIIPTLNERENIAAVLSAAVAALAGEPFEIIVVDDASPDGTGDVVVDFTVGQPRVRLLRKERREGLSAAVLAGFQAASGRYLAVMDADLSHDAALLPALWRALRAGAPVAVGSRRVAGGGADRWPWFRRFYSNVATHVARAWLGVPIRDPMSGYFAIDRRVYEAARPTLNPRGYKVLLEIVTRAQVRDAVEIPFVFRDRKQGHSKLTTRVAIQYAAMLWDLRTYMLPIHRLRQAYHTGRYRKVATLLRDGATLDIGCGRPCETMADQAFLRFLGRPGSVGVDVKPMDGPYEFHAASMTRMPFGAGSFDNVVAMEVLEHVEEVDEALGEVRRVLKPGGLFVMTTPDCHPLWDLVWDRWTRVIGEMWHDTHLVSLRVPEWRALLERHGFVVRGVRRHWLIDLIFCCDRDGRVGPTATAADGR